MKILKFGGDTLADVKSCNLVVQRIKQKAEKGERILVVLAARGDTTDILETILEKASQKLRYQEQLEDLKQEQQIINPETNLDKEFQLIDKILAGVSLLGNYSVRIKDQLLSQGEIICAKLITDMLRKQGVKVNFTDSRKLIVTDEQFGEAKPLGKPSRENVLEHFKKFKNKQDNTVQVVTGFIAATAKNETTTLGRNGSNYTASLLANYLEVSELQNYTKLDGIYTANPNLVPDAKRITQLSYSEANEMTFLGTTIMHAKTIIPLIQKQIPLRMLSIFDELDTGTLISNASNASGITAVSELKKVALLRIEGRGMLRNTGLDARIFSTLARNTINVNLISQAASERSIGIVIDEDKALGALAALKEEFEIEVFKNDISSITLDEQVAVVSIIGKDWSTFAKPYQALIRNQIIPKLFNNTISGKNINLVVAKKDLKRTVRVIHGEIFGISKKVNLALFGHGQVGGTLIDQLLTEIPNIETRKGIQLHVFVIANSQRALFLEDNLSVSWRESLKEKGQPYAIGDIIRFAQKNHLENLIAVDNTASVDLVHQYIPLVQKGFSLVSSNKIANTLDFSYYKKLRTILTEHQKQYLYETNVGAGLPLIDTIKLLHLSGENITRIRGVFSGSLGYIFDTFSDSEILFSKVLQLATEKGYTEPDPREDLSGSDVARKLLILARELDLHNEMEDVQVHNLIPEALQQGSKEDFLNQIQILDPIFQKIKKAQQADHVLRYTGDLWGDLFSEKANLKIQLESVPRNSSLGQVKGSDSIFEIYTASYGDRPILIQGAGAGAAVTARGVFGDILRLGMTKA